MHPQKQAELNEQAQKEITEAIEWLLKAGEAINELKQ